MAGVKKTTTKRGRPRATLDRAKLAALMADHATDAEIAAELGVSVRTIERRRATDPAFREMQSKALALGSLSLKRAMWACALTCGTPDPVPGAVSMAIFWSKQPIERGGLGFSDRATVAVTDAPDADAIDAELVDKIDKLTARKQTRKRTTPKGA